MASGGNMNDDIRWAIQLALACVFLVSTLTKARHPLAFALGVASYGILPKPLSLVLGSLLIPLEAFLALSHLTGWLLSFAAPIGLGVLFLFLVAVVVNLSRGKTVSCYCFGTDGRERLSAQTLVRILLLISGEIFIVTRTSLLAGQLGVPPPISTAVEVAMILPWTLFALAIGMWATSLWELISLLPSKTHFADTRPGHP